MLEFQRRGSTMVASALTVIALTVGAACTKDSGVPTASPAAEAPLAPDYKRSIGHQALTVHLKSTVPSNNPTVSEADALIEATAERFGVPPQLVADMAVKAAQLIEETVPPEDLLDTLDAPLSATLGLDKAQLPELAVVFALYAHARTTGSSPRTAKRVATAMVTLVAGGAAAKHAAPTE
jgi:hypothetical protein